MKSDKLQDAVGMVDTDLVVRTEKKASKKAKAKFIMRWSVPIAAVLAVAIGLTSLFGNGSPFILNTYAVAVAQYPKMSKYPSGLASLGIGSTDDKWREDQKVQRSYRGAGENLGDFIGKTASEILTGAEKENRVYSPLNVYMALAMLAEITGGESREQILTLLDAESIEALRTQANAVWNANYNDDGAMATILANSIWLNNEIDYNHATLLTLAESYHASSYAGKMGSSGFNKALREWLNEQTKGRLKGEIDSLEMSPETIVNLASTIYFYDKWDEEFKKSDNTRDTFHGASRDELVTFMNEKMTYGTYYWGEKFSATHKQLKNSGVMFFILPDEGVEIDTLLSDEQLLSFINEASKNEYENKKSMKVNLTVPKFDVSSNLELSEELKNLGITDCFANANFSPLFDNEAALPEDMTAPYVSEVKHGVRVEIDEEGVTAVAYIEIQGAGSAMPPEDEIDFVVDRPFIFVITGTDRLPLFIGVVNQI